MVHSAELIAQQLQAEAIFRLLHEREPINLLRKMIDLQLELWEESARSKVEKERSTLWVTQVQKRSQSKRRSVSASCR